MDTIALKLFDRVPVLTELNWSVWKWKMELVFKQLDWWSFVAGENPVGVNSNDSTLTAAASSSTHRIVDDERVCALIGLWVDDSLVPLIIDCKTSNEMWLTLVKHFEEPNPTMPKQVNKSTEKKDSKQPSSSETSGVVQTNGLAIESGSSTNTKICSFCDKQGHIASRCFRRKRIIKGYNRVVRKD